VAGGRHFVRVLQLLGAHPQERVQAAVEACLRRNEPHAERVEAEVQRLVGVGQAASVTPLCQIQVPRPDLSRFDQLLSQGEPHDG
jgi:hypothetical protein